MMETDKEDNKIIFLLCAVISYSIKKSLIYSILYYL